MPLKEIKIVKVVNKLASNGKTKLCSIKTLDKNGQDLWLNGFGNTTTESWKDGESVQLEVYQEEYNGKLGWKFKEPTERNIFDELDKINAKLDQVLGNKPDAISQEEIDKLGF